MKCTNCQNEPCTCKSAADLIANLNGVLDNTIERMKAITGLPAKNILGGKLLYKSNGFEDGSWTYELGGVEYNQEQWDRILNMKAFW